MRHNRSYKAHHQRLSLFIAALSVTLLSSCVAPGPRHTADEAAAHRALTFERIYGDSAADFGGDYARGLRWSEDGRIRQRIAGVPQYVDPETAETADIYDVDALADALRESADLGHSDARRYAMHPTALSADRSQALVEHQNTLWLFRFADRELTQLTDEAADRRLFTFSPAGTCLAFVRENNLYVATLPDGAVAPLTHDGSDTLLNGVLDWVYQEEVYGRGNWRAYWWSPDGAHLAYLQLDERNVPVHTVIDYTETHPRHIETRYPKAGDPNPAVRIGIVAAAGGDTAWVDLSAYRDVDILITGMAWAPDGRALFCVQDREQRWLEVIAAEPDGRSTRLLREESPAWVTLFGMPRWLADGTFLWRSARDGYTHLYHYEADGTLIRRVTQGPWEVRDLEGVDEAAGYVYITASADTPLEHHLYCVPLAGGPPQRLTELGFYHRVSVDPRCRYFIDTFSSILTPPQVHLRRIDGGLVRKISQNQVAALDDYQLSPPQFVRVPTPRGYELNAMLIRPPRLEPGRDYPVFVSTYAGPHAPTVRNRWQGRSFFYKQLLARQGFLVWCVDPHSASGESHASAWQAYRRLGVTELEDLEDSLRWLAAHEPADLERAGIYGGSYGGYMAGYAITHGTLFDFAIVEFGLADWRNYDTIYTERYMQTPANNPEGYQMSSVVAAAHQVQGRVLIGHGALDDNVHVQNALQLADALQQAGHDFDLMIYPQDGHGIWHAGAHWRRLKYEFTLDNR